MTLEQLIEEVRKYPCLWNKTLEEYRNQNMRDNAWEVISGELNTPVEDLKCEWKKLQDSHRQAMLRRKTKSGEGARKLKPWKYEALMSFLLAGLTARETQSIVNDAEETEEDSLRITMGGNDNGEEEEERTEPQFENKRDSGGQKGRKDVYKFTRSADKVRDVDKVMSYMEEKKKQKTPRGELDYFFASACESAKALPRRLQLQVKQEVMKAIITAETECLDDSESVVSPIPSANLSCQTPAHSSASSEVYTTSDNSNTMYSW